MPKKKSFEYSTRELLEKGARELTLRIKREVPTGFFSSRDIVRHDLTYGWIIGGKKYESIYHLEHKGFSENDFTQRGLAKLLYEDLLKVLEQGRELKSKGINLKVNLNGMGLTYVNHGHYLPSKELDVLSLPILLMDIKRTYRLK